MPSSSVRSRLLTAKSKPTAPQGRSRRPDGGSTSVLSSDAIGRPVEYPLCSQQPLTDGSRVIKFRGQALDELTYHRLSGPKPKVSNLPFNSASSPEIFDWRKKDVPRMARLARSAARTRQQLVSSGSAGDGNSTHPSSREREHDGNVLHQDGLPMMSAMQCRSWKTTYLPRNP